MKLRQVTLRMGVLVLITIGVISCKSVKKDEELTFSDHIAFYINKDLEVSTGEYLLYAASIVQSTEKEYGAEVWKSKITLDDGNKINYEDYLRQQIVEQIRMTKLLCMEAESYGVALSQEEKEKISAEVTTYFNSINEYNIGEVGIDLSTVLSVYTENTLADKVYAQIFQSVTRKEGVSDDEYYHEKLEYFNNEYEQICKKSSLDWSYDRYVNDSMLSTIMLEKEEKNAAE